MTNKKFNHFKEKGLTKKLDNYPSKNFILKEDIILDPTNNFGDFKKFIDLYRKRSFSNW